MPGVTHQEQTALKYETVVQEDGQIVLSVPLAAGEAVTVFVVQAKGVGDSFQDLTHAASSSLEFWDNPLDDEDWNHA